MSILLGLLNRLRFCEQPTKKRATNVICFPSLKITFHFNFLQFRPGMVLDFQFVGCRDGVVVSASASQSVDLRSVSQVE